MMAPTCLLLLLLFLGHSQAAKVTVKPAERTTAGLVFPIEADFAIKTVKDGETALEVCADTPVAPCITNKVATTVNFAVVPAASSTAVQINGLYGGPKPITIAGLPTGDAEIFGTSSKITGKAAKLDFLPTDIVSVPAPTGEAAKTEPLVKFPSEQTCIDAFTPPCSDIVSGTSKLNVTIDLKSEQVTLMLEGAKGEQVQAVFVPGSAAGWMTPASALIFASLALLFFLH